MASSEKRLRTGASELDWLPGRSARGRGQAILNDLQGERGGSGKAPQAWKNGPWPRRASGAWQGTTSMEKGTLATKGPKMSLPHKTFIKKPGGRGKAARRWKSALGHEWQGRKNMEKCPLAMKGPKMSFPQEKPIEKPVGRDKAPPQTEVLQNVASTPEIYQQTRGARQGRTWPRRARKCRFHTRN